MTGANFYAYVLRLGFKRTDKETEFYEACTDAVEELRRRFGFSADGTEKETTDTISVAGDFKIALESDFGIVSGIVIEDGDIASPLEGPIDKERFDELYPDINVTDTSGYPKHFCVFGGNIYIGPIPDSVDYNYRISYFLKGSTVLTGTASVPFTDAHRDVLAENVLMRMYRGIQNHEEAALHESAFEKGFLLATRRELINTGAHLFNQKATNF
jgi:hypothetical protein